MRQATTNIPCGRRNSDTDFVRVLDRLGECIEYADTLLAVALRLTRSRRGATALFLALVRAHVDLDREDEVAPSRFKKPVLLSLLRRLYIEGAHLPGSE